MSQFFKSIKTLESILCVCVYVLSCPLNFLSLNQFIIKAFDHLVIVMYHVSEYANYVSIIKIIKNKNRDYERIRKMR